MQTSCHAFADPYVEHDALMLLIDLILLKRDVYRHLLFNRGLGARRAVRKGDDELDRSGEVCARRRWEKARWFLILRLGCALVAVDAFIRWTYFRSSASTPSSVSADPDQWPSEASADFFRIFAGCVVETVAFHVGITLASFIVLKTLAYVRSWRRTAPSSVVDTSSGIHEEFRYSHIPLTLLYSSLTKLFLLFLLSIWRPYAASPSAASDALSASSHDHVPLAREASIPDLGSWAQPLVLSALQVLDEDRLDRAWVIRNLLGGMAAGFGLRVVLDCHPLFTTMIILAGWAIKTTAAGLVGNWVGGGMGGDGRMGEAWLAYSIP